MITHIMKFLFMFFTIAVAACQTNAKDMTFDIIYNNHTDIVVADGTITKDTPLRFQAFLDETSFGGFYVIIDLNSHGGNLLAAIELGRMIRKHNMTSKVWKYGPRKPWPGKSYHAEYEGPGECYSACALAFLGGKVREIPDNSKIGFHQFSGSKQNSKETEITTQFLTGKLLEYITAMGAAPTLLSRMTETLPHEMYIPSRAELRAYSIISDDVFSGFDFKPYNGGVIASAALPENVQGTNMVYELVTFCKQGTPFIALFSNKDFQGLDPSFLNCAYGKTGTSGFELHQSSQPHPVLSYPWEAVRFATGSQLLATIQVDNRFLDVLRRGRTRAAVQFAHMCGGLMLFSIEATPNDLDRIASSFKICVQ